MNNRPGPRPRNHLGWKIATFLASLALGFSGILNTVVSITAYLGGDLVGAVGTGADRALEHGSATVGATGSDADIARELNSEPPDPDRVSRDTKIKQVSDSAHAFALRAKLFAIGIGLVAAVQLLAGVLVRKRYRSRAVPITLALGIAGELALAIALHPSILMAIGIVACAGGWLVWAKTPPEDHDNVLSWD